VQVSSVSPPSSQRWNYNELTVWTVEKGIVIQVREYFDTTITVTDFKVCEKKSPSTVWESSVVKFNGKSMSGVLLSI
jgi:hypothetical protein